MAQNKKSRSTIARRKRVRVGGKRGFSDLALWQKALALAVFAVLVSSVSIAVFSRMKERDMLARAGAYTKVDVKSNPKSSAGVSFSACKTTVGDRYKITILAVKPASVKNASVAIRVYGKNGSTQYYSRQSTAKSWWGDQVTAVQVDVLKNKGGELIFTAKSSQGSSSPRYLSQPSRKSFKTRTSYESALRSFRAATISPLGFVDCTQATANPTATSTCLSRGGGKQTIAKLQKAAFRNYTTPKDTVFDARQAYWDGSDANGQPISWAITVDGNGPACWYGGKYSGAWDDRSKAVTWSKDYHHAGAFTIRMPSFLVEGFRAHNQGDGIRMEQRASNFHIKDVYLSDIHDDCVENDFLHGGITENSLFDGCYAGFSAATFEGINPNGNGNTWTIRNNLLRLKPFYTMFKPEKYGNYGYSMLFKGWFEKGKGPSLVLENNIFMADRPPSIGRLDIPANANLKSCKNNTFVWLGSGPMPYKDLLPKGCFTFTTDRAVWDGAVAGWKAAHPNVR